MLEFRLGLTSDKNRVEQLLGSLADRCHPMSKFMWGTSWSLNTTTTTSTTNNNDDDDDDLIARAFSSAGLPVTEEPSGLFRSDGKWPDGLTLVPWSNGKALGCHNNLSESQVQRQSLLLSTRKRSTLLLMAGTSLSRSPLRLFAFLTHQLASSSLILVGKFPRVLGKPEKRAFCSKDARC